MQLMEITELLTVARNENANATYYIRFNIKVI